MSEPINTEELHHNQVLQENNLSESDLPSELKMALKSIKMQLAHYEKNPTEGRREAIVRASANLGHGILDFVEKDLPDAPDDEEVEAAVEAPPVVIEPVLVPPIPPQQIIEDAVAPPAQATPPPPPAPPVEVPKKQGSNGIFDIFGWK